MGQLLLAGVPYWLPSALALFWAIRAPGRLPRVWRFSNPYAAAGILLVLLRLLSIPASLLLFSALGCEGGMIDPITCTRAADGFGAFLDRFSFIGVSVVVAVGLPSLAMCGLAEWLTRRRRVTT